MGDLLRDEVIQRAMASMSPPAIVEPARPAAPTKDHSTLLGVLSALADGASTAHLMKKGGVEGNAIYGQPQSPMKTGLAVAGSGLADVAAMHLLGKKFPKLAKMLGAQTTAHRIGLAGENVAREGWRPNGGSSIDAYHAKVMRAMSGER